MMTAAPKIAADDCETGLCAPTASASLNAQPAAQPSASSSSAAAAVEAPSQPAPGAKEDPLDASTFVKPLGQRAIEEMPSPSIVIEFCDRCRWLHRAAWVQTELFITFSPPSSADATPSKASGGAVLHGITLLPLRREETGGRFRVWLISEAEAEAQSGGTGKKEMSLVWDRKIKGAFPELKELKQLIRDRIAPQHSLGHSDRKH